jgi:rhodanese-related sulfurtransferase
MQVTGPSPPRSRRRLAALVAVVALVGVAGCGSDDGATGTADPPAATAGTDLPEPGVDAAAAALDEDRTVIDVRTPEEYDAGHVDGATLIDVQADDFDDLVADLDPDDTYVAYCRTGVRSEAAAERMRAEGLDVYDGGGLSDMVEADWPEAT